MANSYTPNYSWILPEVGLDTDAWGTHINYNFGDTINGLDAIVHGISNVANAALPRAGGTITGPVTFTGTSSTITMSAPIILSADPISSTHAARKNYVDIGDNTNALAAAAAQTTANAAVIRAGDTMTGYLTLFADPTIDKHASTKKYTDTKLSLSGGTMTGNIVFDISQTTATTSLPNIVKLTDSISSTSITTAATPNSVKVAYDLANAALSRSGGTMTGALTLAADPASALQAATAQYVYNNFQPLNADLTAIAAFTGTGFAKRTGTNTWTLDTNTYLTGNQSISLSGDATGSGATSIAVTLANSGVSAGTYNNSSSAISPYTVDSKGRITGVGGAVTITPAWTNITGKPTTVDGYGISDAVKTSGSTMSGVLTFASTQTTATTSTPNIVLLTDSTSSTSTTTAATPNSVKNAYDLANAALARSGDTMSGYLTLNGDPTSALHAATKQYTDNRVATALPLTGGTLSGNITISNTANYITLQDTDNSTFYIYNNSNNSGFLKPDQAWAFYTDTSGNFTAAQNITAYSDEKLKEDIQTIEYALDRVKMLRGVYYTRKDTKTPGLGVIAQEVQRVFPEVVHHNNDGILSVAYGNLVGVLIEAVKELADRVEELEYHQ